VIKLPAELDGFCFAATQHEISVVNLKDGHEYELVKQRFKTELDCLEGVFVTHKNERNQLATLTIHYFEKFFDDRKKLKACTYNTFELTEDFINMLTSCGHVIPGDRSKLVKKIKKFKSEMSVAEPEDSRVLDADIRLGISLELQKIELAEDEEE